MVDIRNLSGVLRVCAYDFFYKLVESPRRLSSRLQFLERFGLDRPSQSACSSCDPCIACSETPLEIWVSADDSNLIV